MTVFDYEQDMERSEHALMETVLELTAAHNETAYGTAEVECALSSESLSAAELGALLSESAEPYLERMAQRAKQETARYFGNSVSLFTPLYIANYCENYCTYCGYCADNRIRRGKLTEDDIERELEAVAHSGLREILLLTGESRSASGVEYIGRAVELAAKYMPVVGLEVYPLNTEEYRYLHGLGADYVSVYQETYNAGIYSEAHPAGPKRSFPYRFNAQERALRGGMRGVAFGSLLGLGSFREDAFAAAVHAHLIQRRYPHAEISFSFPRLRPYINSGGVTEPSVGERKLLQAMLAYRLFMPFAGITLSTRERAFFRDNAAGLVATKLSAGVKVSVGGHAGDAQGDEQFEIADSRSVDELRAMLSGRGLQAVFRDYVRT